jgi:hypothetical protein
MADFITRVKTIFDAVKAAPAKKRAHFTVPRDHVLNPIPLGPPFKEREHYLQIIINEMFLANGRQWFSTYDPMAFVASSYIYDTALNTSPFVVGPQLLDQFKTPVPEGMIFENVPVSGLHPYQGGTLTLTIILNQLQRQNNAEKMLKIAENVAGSIDPSSAFTTYLKVAGTVVDAVEAIFGLNETTPLMGYHTTINPQVNQLLEPEFMVLLNVDEQKVDPAQYWVKNDRLYSGPTLDNAQPYRGSDFVLLSIAQGIKRSDERLLPFYPLWVTTQDLAAQVGDHYWIEAKSQFNTLKRDLLKSPDLTDLDRDRFQTEYLTKLKNLRLQTATESELNVQPQLPDSEARLQKIAEELDSLDKL